MPHQKTFGSLIYIGAATSPAPFTKIDEVFRIGEFVPEVGDIDFSNHDDTAGGYRDYEPEDLEDGSVIEVEANEVPGNASQNLVRAAHAARSKVYWKAVAKNGRTIIFRGHTRKCGTNFEPLQDRQVFKFSVKVDGPVYETTP